MAQLLAAMAQPPAPEAAWWRRALALDTGDRARIFANVAVAVVLAVLVDLTGLAVVAAQLAHPMLRR